MLGSRVPARAVALAASLASVFTLMACGTSSTSVVAPTGEKCQITVTNNTPQVPAAGGTGSVAVETSRDCQWSATVDATWIALSATTGQGAATVSYSVQVNPNGTARQAQIRVADQAVNVAQAAAPCRYQLAPATVDVAATGGQVMIALTATNACGWNVRADASWIARPTPADGTGSATIAVTVAANSDVARAGTVTVGDATVRINQAPGTTPPPSPTPSPTPTPPPPPPPPSPSCTYRLSSVGRNVGRNGDGVSVGVTAPSGCAWTAVSDVDWIDVVAGRSGTGNDTVRLSVAANPGGPRTGTVRIARELFTIEQDGRVCKYSIKPGSYHSGKGPDDIRIDVTTDPGCTWTTSSNVSWVTVAEGQTGSGNGTVRLLVAPNSGRERSTTLTIATQRFDLRQNGSD
jgi:hypothetical protein